MDGAQLFMAGMGVGALVALVTFLAALAAGRMTDKRSEKAKKEAV